MTFKQKIHEYLRSLCFFENDITAIIQAVIDDKRTVEMKSRWNDNVNGYSEFMVNLLLITVNAITLDWLKEHMPEHFVIPFLENKVYGTPIPEAKDE